MQARRTPDPTPRRSPRRWLRTVLLILLGDPCLIFLATMSVLLPWQAWRIVAEGGALSGNDLVAFLAIAMFDVTAALCARVLLDARAGRTRSLALQRRGAEAWVPVELPPGQATAGNFVALGFATVVILLIAYGESLPVRPVAIALGVLAGLLAVDHVRRRRRRGRGDDVIVLDPLRQTVRLPVRRKLAAVDRLVPLAEVERLERVLMEDDPDDKEPSMRYADLVLVTRAGRRLPVGTKMAAIAADTIEVRFNQALAEARSGQRLDPRRDTHQ